jgi:hypothetical protein
MDTNFIIIDYLKLKSTIVSPLSEVFVDEFASMVLVLAVLVPLLSESLIWEHQILQWF